MLDEAGRAPRWRVAVSTRPPLLRQDGPSRNPAIRPRLDDSPETLGIGLVHAGHPRFIAGVEERAGGCEFGPHRVVQPGHVQEVAPQGLGLAQRVCSNV